MDIPIVLTIVSLDEPLEERMLHSGASIVNVSGGKNTVAIIKALREIDKTFPIIATGGPSEETIKEVIQAGLMRLLTHHQLMVKYLKNDGKISDAMFSS